MGKANIEFIGTSGIHKQFLNKIYSNVQIITNNQGAIVLKTETEEVFHLNPNFQIRFGPCGIEIEGYFLIDKSLGMASILITKYETNERNALL
jgi:hypothetical protein